MLNIFLNNVIRILIFVGMNDLSKWTPRKNKKSHPQQTTVEGAGVVEHISLSG
jgi:hypothetical protein